jgi:hypothetical protein
MLVSPNLLSQMERLGWDFTSNELLLAIWSENLVYGSIFYLWMENGSVAISLPAVKEKFMCRRLFILKMVVFLCVK